MRYRSSSLRRGLSLVEMLVSIPLVGIALVAALNTVGASKVSQFKVSVGREGHLLAQALMSEIRQQDYADVEIAQALRDDILSTGDATYTLGPDIFPGRDEVATGDRSLFNDVDDYDGWSASPPQPKDGPEFAGLQGWERSVSVVFVSVNDLKTALATDYGTKLITVTVTYNDVPAAELMAVETIGLPWLEACCFDDGSCEDLRAEACAAQGGTAQGPGTICATTECPTGPTVLLVITDDSNPSLQTLARRVLMESWGFAVDLISASASQADLDSAAANADVAYISEEVSSIDLGTKLKEATIGVVIEKMRSEFGIATGWGSKTLDYIRIVDNSHHITSSFDIGELTYLSSLQPVTKIDGGYAPGLNTLGEMLNVGSIWKPALAVIEAGGELSGGGSAAGRRVQLPWGGDGFDFNVLNSDGQTIMKRAIEWAAGMETVCGDGTCDTGEDSCGCPADCGEPAHFEEPGVTCDDGLDNDCDGSKDCEDINCPADPACMICGNSLCELGEDCNSCSTDCPSETGGKPSDRYCCGNGIAESAEGDGSICDGNY